MSQAEFRQNNFDLIRLIAALQVVVVHGYEHFDLSQGKWFIDFISIFPGVPIFFVISGFLISASWEKNPSISYYVKNRILRIFPALWVCFIFSVLSVAAVYPLSMTIAGFVKWAAAQLSIGQFYNPEFLRGYGVGVLNGSLWTIPVELQFYAVLPMLYYIFSRLKWHIALLAISLVVLIAVNQGFIALSRTQDSLPVKLLGVTVLPYLYIFIVGIVLQRNLEMIKKYLVDRALVWLFFYLCASALFSYMGLTNAGNNINPVLAILIAFLTLSFALTGTAKLSGLLKDNDISYGVYIYHMVFVNLLIHLNAFPSAINFLIMLVCTVLMALMSWRFVEKPALSLKNR